MDQNTRKKYIQRLFVVVITCITNVVFCQDSTAVQKPAIAKSEFWKKVQFGGGLGLNFGTGFSDVNISPTAIYKVTDLVYVGTGLQLSYVSVRNDYNSFIYGGSLLGLFNPLQEIQLSFELEQLRINTKISGAAKLPGYWNTGLFVGAGYRVGNVTLGGRYNVLFNKNDRIYNNAFTPFVRIFF
jgi:hypothetical protein